MAVDEDWDVILIGAGQNNFALGTYLGMAGLETVICESRLENGGRLFSEEIPLPGYWHNSLAYFQDNREVSPVWRELDWENGHHAEFVTPPVISTLLLPGGASVSHHQDLDGTLASLAHHSAADRAAWKDAHQRFRGIVRDIVIPSYYAPPEAAGALEERIAADPAGHDFLRLARMSAAEAAEHLFESEAVRTLVLSQMAIPRGWALDYEGGGREVLALIAGDERPQLARGGSHSIAQVLQRAYVMHGGQIRALHHVDSILVEEGRAVGVRLRDGREWKARRAVVSNVDPHGTFIDMVGEEHLDAGFAQAVRAIQPDEFSYFQVHLALKAPLRFAVHEAADSFVGRAMNVNYGPRSVEDLQTMWREIRAGEFPERPCLHVTCPTWFDALQAPPAKHTASVFMPVPYQLKGHQPEDWVNLKNGFMEQVVSALREVATNLTDDNIVMKVAMDPCYLAGRWQNMRRGSVWVARKTPDQMGQNRPIPQLAQYRTPIEGLYQVGVATHPADAVIAGSGRAAWSVMRQDLGLGVRP